MSDRADRLHARADARAKAAAALPVTPDEWPTEERTRRGVRQITPPPGMVYDSQIRAALGLGSVGPVRNYYHHRGPDGTCLPGGPPFSDTPHERAGENLLIPDDHWRYYATEADALRIYRRLRWSRAGGLLDREDPAPAPEPTEAPAPPTPEATPMSEHEWTFPATVEPDNYDGDTFSVALDLGFGAKLEKTVQLEGVDAPERNAKDPAVRALAERARREAAAFLSRAKRIVFRSTAWQRRSRDAVGDLVADGKSLAEWLVEMRYAVPSDGDRSRDARQARAERHAQNARDLAAGGQLEV